MSEAPASLKRRRPSWMSAIWLVPILAGVAVVAIVQRKVQERGPVVEISFSDAQGLTAGKSDLVYRGAALGFVQSLSLGEDERVVARVQLSGSAEVFARRGARFWIVKPRFSAGQVSGLDTFFTGPFIGASPGEGEPETRFRALDTPPVVEGDRQGLRVVLISAKAGSLAPGAPVLYRGVRVGAIGSVDLAADGRAVRAEAVIERPYRRLVAATSKFWTAGGLDVRFGLLKGAQLSADSLATLVGGGVAFATPDPPGAAASDGQGFMLADKPEEAWLRWTPSLPMAAPAKKRPAAAEIRHTP